MIYNKSTLADSNLAVATSAVVSRILAGVDDTGDPAAHSCGKEQAGTSETGCAVRSELYISHVTMSTPIAVSLHLATRPWLIRIVWEHTLCFLFLTYRSHLVL